MVHFTPVSALIGGLAIGVASVCYLVLTGGYAGVSGILRGAVFGDPDRAMDILFVAGLVLGGLVWFTFVAHPAFTPAGSLWLVALGGLFVGFGTALGRGCTSGHGVCGLGRLSFRSFSAVASFLATGMVTVFVVRHVLGL